MPHLIKQPQTSDSFSPSGLFLHSDTLPSSFISFISSPSSSSSPSNLGTVSCFSWGPRRRVVIGFEIFTVEGRVSGMGGGGFLSLSLSLNRSGGDQTYARESGEILEQHEKKVEERVCQEKENVGVSNGSGAMNMTKHLWAGAVAAMVSRTLVAPLERLKLEYIVRGEQKILFELIRGIAASQGLKGFWKGNFVNILRTAPFKAINFYAYDTYRNKLVRMLGNEESTNLERFIAGAAVGITATLLCLPMDIGSGNSGFSSFSCYSLITSLCV